jgi:MFS family permease
VRRILQLLKLEPRARWFFAVLAQSSLGTGAAHVALLLIAYERFGSAWAVGLVLLADLLPAMLLGPILGAAADRWPRRWCAVAGDVMRALAFLGIALVGDFGITLALALLAGTGNALFKPAALSALPTLVEPERSAAATSLYGAVTDLGYTVGPALTAGALLIVGAEEIMLLNSATFAISAIVLLCLRWGYAADTGQDGRPPSLLREARLGLSATAAMTGIRVVIAASAAAMLMGGYFNVAEPLFAIEVLGAGGSGFALLVAVYGLGFVGGSIRGAGGGEPGVLKRRYLGGLLTMALGFLISGLAPGLAIALLGFGLAGVGNGLLLVHERLLIQMVVPGDLQGRVFAVSDTVVSWAFGAAFLSAGGVISGVGSRETIILAGAGGLVFWMIALVGLRREWRRPTDPQPVLPPEAQPSLEDQLAVLNSERV